jgi:hypothetical protein
MWIIQEQTNGNWFAGKYTTELVNGKITRKWLDQVTGTKRQALDFMLSYREEVPVSELTLGLRMMEETGDDTAQFGVLGGFVITTNEQMKAVA